MSLQNLPPTIRIEETKTKLSVFQYDKLVADFYGDDREQNARRFIDQSYNQRILRCIRCNGEPLVTYSNDTGTIRITCENCKVSMSYQAVSDTIRHWNAKNIELHSVGLCIDGTRVLLNSVWLGNVTYDHEDLTWDVSIGLSRMVSPDISLIHNFIIDQADNYAKIVDDSIVPIRYTTQEDYLLGLQLLTTRPTP